MMGEKTIKEIEKFAKWLEDKNYLSRTEIDFDWYDKPVENVIMMTKEEVVKEYLESRNEDVTREEVIKYPYINDWCHKCKFIYKEDQQCMMHHYIACGQIIECNMYCEDKDEMSREDAVDYLRQVKDTYWGYKKIPGAFDKAFDDMNKMQKIEEIIKHNKGCVDIPDSDCNNDHYKCQIKRIEKILIE